MKTFKSIFFALTILSFALTSCNKENMDVDTEDVTMTTDEAAENVEMMMVTAIDDVEAMAYSAEEAYKTTGGEWAIDCGAVIDTTWTKSRTNGSASANYTSTWEMTVLCNNFNLPTGLALSSAANGNYEGPLVSGNESGAGEYSIEGLLPNATTYDLAGTYVANGSATMKKGRMVTYTLSLVLTISNASFDKETKKLVSGECTIELIATGQNVGPATFNGLAVFNGDGSVTVTINGKTYTFPI